MWKMRDIGYPSTMLLLRELEKFSTKDRERDSKSNPTLESINRYRLTMDPN